MIVCYKTFIKWVLNLGQTLIFNATVTLIKNIICITIRKSLVLHWFLCCLMLWTRRVACHVSPPWLLWLHCSHIWTPHIRDKPVGRQEKTDVCCVLIFVIYLTYILSVIQEISSEHPFCQICYLRDKNDRQMTSSVHSYGSKNLTHVFQLQRPHSTEVNAIFRCGNMWNTVQKC